MQKRAVDALRAGADAVAACPDAPVEVAASAAKRLLQSLEKNSALPAPGHQPGAEPGGAGGSGVRCTKVSVR